MEAKVCDRNALTEAVESERVENERGENAFLWQVEDEPRDLGEVRLVVETVLDDSGHIILPESVKRYIHVTPGRQMWLCLTDAGLLAAVDGDHCRICGEKLHPDAPCVICARCIREVRELPMEDEIFENMERVQ